ncbi:hypothetical protein F3Y22_tig00004360pilonHSYRG00010 [Hibiscus syriacus]|uniref:Uncharacterized protein n=1 Tax=Hibiscus syriacus TaxID=106335 RepID=A0A6A3CGF9_HIBSY|nr:hypothetical protein F3Y22_tig00004360pilonHSYRG00010 [Hibiscus syriacus]
MWKSIDMRNLGDLHYMEYDPEKMYVHAVNRSCGRLLDINIEYFGTYELLFYISERTKMVIRLFATAVAYHCSSFSLQMLLFTGLLISSVFDYFLAMTFQAKGRLQLLGNGLTNEGLQAILDGCPHLDLRQCFNEFMRPSHQMKIIIRMEFQTTTYWPMVMNDYSEFAGASDFSDYDDYTFGILDFALMAAGLSDFSDSDE